MTDASRDIGLRLLSRAESDAERAAAIVRLAVACILLVGIELVLWDSGLDGPGAAPVQRQIDAARLFLVALFALGVLSYVAQRRRWGGRARPFVTVTLDAALILGNLFYSLHLWDLPGNFFLMMPVLWMVPVVIAGMVIHYRVGLQIYVACLYLLGLVVVWYLAGNLEPEARAARLPELTLLVGPPPHWIRLIMLASMAGILVVAAWRGRALLLKAVDDAAGRAALSRFLPAEIARLINSENGRSLREGRRQLATMLFVDIRNSVSHAEGLDPARLSVFISSFRRRVSAAAALHGGVVDKFIGDGALVVFGLPEPRADDAVRAVACAEDLARVIVRWNGKRQFDPPVRVGIGVHTGEVYCGLVGDDSRLEFTVLGDAVNVASRIEQATKVHGRTVLISEATLAALPAELSQPLRWEMVSREPVRGRSEPIAYFTPAPG